MDPSTYTSLQQQQQQHPHIREFRRSYLYLPTSWKELQLRWQSFQERTIPVRFKKKNLRVATDVATEAQEQAQEERMVQGPLRTATRERVGRMVKGLRFHAHERVQLARSRAVMYYRTQRARFKMRRKQITARRKQRLLTAKANLQQKFDARSDALKQRFRTRTSALRTDMQLLWDRSTARYYDYRYNITKHVTIKEYTEADWFDAVGRPLTSRDPTGRFVNPWLSKSSNGVHSLMKIVQWRWERLKREFESFGWKVIVPSFWKGRTIETVENMNAVASLNTLKRVSPIALEQEEEEEDKEASASAPASSQQLQISFTWLGHATCLVRQGAITVLTDPMFSERASPFQNSPIGIARDIPAPFTIQDLPFIDVCLISHDHYDHLDRESVLLLKNKVGKWVVPIGIADWMQTHGNIARRDLIELEWWESVRLQQQRRSNNNSNLNRKQWKAIQFASVEDSHVHMAYGPSPVALDQIIITCCPAQHWASRTFFDRNYRLWCSFAVFFPVGTFYFGADSALPRTFPLFEQIADHVGPIDLAALPIGAYAPDWFMKDSHMNPREALMVHQKLQANASVGIHWGTFQLSEEPLGEPSVWLQREVEKEQQQQHQRFDFVTIPHGASVRVDCRRRRGGTELNISSSDGDPVDDYEHRIQAYD